MEPVYDALTITAIISVACVALLILAVLNCCKTRENIRKLLINE